MPILDALYLALAIAALCWLTHRGRLHPVLALLLVTFAFAQAAEITIAQTGRDFGRGFAQVLQSAGLAVLVGAVIGECADRSGAVAALAARLGARVRTVLPTVLGLTLGATHSALAAFAVATPIRRALGGPRATLAAGLGAIAGQGLSPLTPATFAATAVLAADPVAVALFAPPALAAAGLVGGLQARRWPQVPAAPASDRPNRRALPAMLIAVLAMVAALLFASLGHIPSEPLGRGGARALVLGVAHPMVLAIVGLGLWAIVAGRFDRGVWSETGWAGDGLVRAVPAILLVGMAGGLSVVMQELGMAELLAEPLTTLRYGLCVPFLLALTVKAFQGSTLVAAITAAGMIEPLLGPLGLDTGAARALTVLAVGAGATAATHINDPLFWLIQRDSGLSPGAALGAITIGSLVQAVAALGVLLALAGIAG